MEEPISTSLAIFVVSALEIVTVIAPKIFKNSAEPLPKSDVVTSIDVASPVVGVACGFQLEAAPKFPLVTFQK